MSRPLISPKRDGKVGSPQSSGDGLMCSREEKKRRKAHPRHTLPIEAIGVKDTHVGWRLLRTPCAVALAGAGGVEGGLPGSQEKWCAAFFFLPRSRYFVESLRDGTGYLTTELCSPDLAASDTARTGRERDLPPSHPSPTMVWNLYIGWAPTRSLYASRLSTPLGPRPAGCV